jgi:hypothetical protein
MRKFENRVLRRIFGPKRDEVTGGWRKLYDELHSLYSSSYIIRVTKSRRMRWVEYVGCIWRQEIHTIFWLGSLKGRDHLDDLGIVKWII